MRALHPAADSRDEPEQLAALEAAIAEREAADSANARPRFVVIGVGAGFKAEVNLLALMGKRALLRGSTRRARPLEEKAATAAKREARRAKAERAKAAAAAVNTL